MARTVLIAGIVCGVASILCALIALATANWMTACTTLKELMNAAAPDSSNGTPAQNPFSGNPQLQQLASASMCFNTGLFVLSFSMPQMGVSYSISLSPTSFGAFIEATAGLLVTSMILLVVGVILISLSVCSKSMNAQRKVSAGAYGRIGAGVMIVAAVLYAAGVIVYTAEQSKAVHNPGEYSMQISSAMQATFSKMFAGFGGGSQFQSNMGNIGGRKRRQNEDSNSYNEPRLGKHQDSTDLNHMPDLPVHEEVMPSYNTNMNSAFSAEQMKEQMQKMFGGLDPVFGYSFFVSWVGFVFALLSALLSATSFLPSSVPFSEDMHPVL